MVLADLGLAEGESRLEGGGMEYNRRMYESFVATRSQIVKNGRVNWPGAELVVGFWHQIVRLVVFRGQVTTKPPHGHAEE